ncbi:cbb3-type cytochrome oxidase assembly protein CcoS [Paenochrobactrum glaciei]|uniref:Cbb3-type cytochrome oxidase assembly protein CcoS n=1 Tax=Paenochrobactrum glaciei TaxID=486407 RepID=A0ABN1GH71_9HYPH
MSSLIFLIPIALILGGVALAAFFWTLNNGQYEDMEGAGHRIFIDDQDETISKP